MAWAKGDPSPKAQLLLANMVAAQERPACPCSLGHRRGQKGGLRDELGNRMQRLACQERRGELTAGN